MSVIHLFFYSKRIYGSFRVISFYFTWVGGIKLLEVDDEEREEDADEGAGGK